MNTLEPLMTSARTGDKSKDEWRTPLWLYTKLDQEFNFDLDPAATEDNALAPYYYTQAEDGLVQPWWGNVFINPPYSQAKHWIFKAKNEIILGNTDVVVLLLAARTDTQIWWSTVRFQEVRFLKGRLKFGISPEEKQKRIQENILRAADGKKLLDVDGSSAPFPSALSILRKGGDVNKTVYWDIGRPK